MASQKSTGELLSIAKDISPGRILLVTVVGSHMRGLADPHSDMDLRFVYAYDLARYASLRQPTDRMTRLVDDVEVDGWDIRRFLSLLAKSNPTALEWALSPQTLFSDESLSGLRKLAMNAYSPKTVALANLGLSRSKQADLSGRTADVKDCLSAITSMATAHAAISSEEYPPIPYGELVSAHVPAGRIRETARMLAERKREGAHTVSHPHLDLIRTWLADQADIIMPIASSMESTQPAWDIAEAFCANIITSCEAMSQKKKPIAGQ